jgi:hypothetical protein
MAASALLRAGHVLGNHTKTVVMTCLLLFKVADPFLAVFIIFSMHRISCTGMKIGRVFEQYTC